MAAIGLAYDLKRVSPEMIRKRKVRTGDIHTHGNYGLYNQNDTEVSENDKKKTHYTESHTSYTLVRSTRMPISEPTNQNANHFALFCCFIYIAISKFDTYFVYKLP